MAIIEEVVAELHYGTAPFGVAVSCAELPEVQKDGPLSIIGTS